MSEFRKLEATSELDFSKYTFEGMGLITAIAIDPKKTALEGLLMVAYANKEAVETTMGTHIATYWSRSKKGLWVKGKTSGNYQLVDEIYVDCDADTVIYAVTQKGPACHTGAESCFLIAPNMLRREDDNWSSA